MKKQIIPYAVVATLTLGTTGMTAHAIDLDEAREHFPNAIDWSETDWNSYLDENYGTSLADYDTNLDLEADVGPPIDFSALNNADLSDPIVLDIMERYNLTAEELILFLDTYDNVEDIYFFGDLENALELEGFELIDTGEDAEEPAPEEDTDEPVVEPDQDTDEPVVEEEPDQGTDEPVAEEEPDQGTDEPVAEEEPVYAFDPAQLETVYLTPLGWTEEDFAIYVEDNYGMPLADFESFEELESIVGPVLDDEQLPIVLDSYGLTPEEYSDLLAEYGEVPEDYYFVYDLEESLDYYTSEEAENAETETGAEMPETATDSVMMILAGLGVAAAGAFVLFRRKPQGEQ